FTKNTGSIKHELVSADSVRNILLPDGSRIWLNKFSKLTWPENYGEEIRTVSLEGEAYFEVAKNKTKPFVVVSGKIITQVLGTVFNVSQQKNGVVKVTLSEGSVLVKKDKNEMVLSPGEVATYSGHLEGLTKESNRDINFLT